MVLLTITPSVLEALKMRAEATSSPPEDELIDGEPNLDTPAVGDPI